MRRVGGGYEYHKIDCANSQRFNDNIKQLNVEALAIPLTFAPVVPLDCLF